MAEEPVGVLGVFALLLHQPHKRAPLVDGTAGVLDLLVENVEAFARGWHGPAIRTGGYLVPGHRNPPSLSSPAPTRALGTLRLGTSQPTSVTVSPEGQQPLLEEHLVPATLLRNLLVLFASVLALAVLSASLFAANSPSLAFLGVHFQNDNESLEPTSDGERARLVRTGEEFTQQLSASGRFKIVPTSDGCAGKDCQWSGCRRVRRMRD